MVASWSQVALSRPTGAVPWGWWPLGCSGGGGAGGWWVVLIGAGMHVYGDLPVSPCRGAYTSVARVQAPQVIGTDAQSAAPQ
jgi:hypothetical protein